MNDILRQYVDSQELSLRVRKAMDEGDFVLVDSILSETNIQLDGTQEDWWVRSLYLSKEFERCIIKCDEILERGRERWIVLLFKARSLSVMGRKEASISEYQKLERMFPEEREPLVVLIRHHYAMEEWDEALELDSRLLELDSENEQGLLFKGRIHHRMSQTELALNSYTELVQKFPEHLEGHSRVGQLLYENREYHSAKDSLMNALEIDSEYRPARRLIGLCLEKLGQSDRAIEWLMREAEREPQDYSNWIKIIDIKLKTSDDEGAKEVVENAASLIENEMEASILKYKLSRDINWEEGADDASAILEKKFTNDFFYHKMMIDSAFEEGRISLAKKFIDRMESSEGVDMGYHDEAKRRFGNILQITKQEVEFIDTTIEKGVEIHVSELAIKRIVELCTSKKNRKPHGRRTSVIHVSSSMGRGGAERQLINCIRGTLGSDKFGGVSLCTYSKQGSESLIAETMETGVKIHEYGNNIDIDKTIIDNNLEIFKDLIQLLPVRFAKDLVELSVIFNKLRPGLVNSWQDGTNIVAALAAMIARVPTVIMFGRSMRPDVKTMAHVRNRPYLKMGYQLILNDSRFCLCLNSERGRDSYTEWLEIDKEKLLVLHNGLDIESMKKKEYQEEVSEFLEDSNIPEGSEIVGGVFRFVREKRLDLWVESAIETIQRREGVYFIGVGDGPERDRISKMVMRRGFEDRIFFPSKTEFVGSWLKAFDLFLLTSIIEGLPNVLIEAQGYGVPVLSTRAGGSEDTFENYKGGVLLMEEEASVIAEQICLCLDDYSWREKASRTAIKNAEEKFSIQVMMGNLTEIYNRKNEENLQRWEKSASLPRRMLASMGWN